MTDEVFKLALLFVIALPLLAVMAGLAGMGMARLVRPTPPPVDQAGDAISPIPGEADTGNSGPQI